MSHQSVEFDDLTPAAPVIEPGEAACSTQLTVQPEITKVECVPNPAKMQSVEITQGQKATIQFVLRDRNGDPIDLTTCSDGTVKLRLRESLGRSDTVVEIDGAFVDAVAGTVRAQLTSGVANQAGIAIAEFGVLDPDSNLVFSNTFYLVINRGHWGTKTTTQLGPPTVAEIRLHLRDSSPVDQFLLDEFAFDNSELAMAISRPVEYFNELRPPVRTFSTQNFKFRFHWLEAIVGQLMIIAASHYRQAHLSYTAAGVTVDDKNREREFLAEGQRRWQAFATWAQREKCGLNAEQAWAIWGSGYGNPRW